jgi:rsbT co-antagonist protein RsbR
VSISISAYFFGKIEIKLQGDNPMNDGLKTEIGGLLFEWDMEKGKFIFENKDAVLFWISNSMKMFFDTIEEISGDEASNLVLEATGFRQGMLVGSYFEKLKGKKLSEIASLIRNTYASAGWGEIKIKELNWEENTLTVCLKDTWEHKITVAQGKSNGGKFLPAHCAGIFTALFETNIWYEIVQDQLEGHEYTIVKYYPSKVTISDNIHQLARRRELEQISQLQSLVDAKTKEIKELVKKIPSPILPVYDGVVVVPLIGEYDEDRAGELVIETLHQLPGHKANYLILDLTGLSKNITEQTAAFISKIGSAASLLGTETILVGISQELSMVISKSNINFLQFDCFQTLQHGIHFALSQSGRKMIK